MRGIKNFLLVFWKDGYMGKYAVESNIEIRFKTLFYSEGENIFKVQSKIEKNIYDIINNDDVLNSIRTKPKNLKIKIISRASRTNDF